ncbi:hypothetical protein [Thalassomonas sp. M1454]|uniref:hypothetical protein n=1 Tax=Thalassomonas sp. M1454 TaxID=2594477 RepID=UPI00117EE369|nr:hypothetical protein [Thalassomonas sp. M1454]TRX57176.1 hypothetical protein FNN08_06670 [Thalassomonas sp. M1454]
MNFEIKQYVLQSLTKLMHLLSSTLPNFADLRFHCKIDVKEQRFTATTAITNSAMIQTQIEAPIAKVENAQPNQITDFCIDGEFLVGVIKNNIDQLKESSNVNNVVVRPEYMLKFSLGSNTDNGQTLSLAATVELSDQKTITEPSEFTHVSSILPNANPELYNFPVPCDFPWEINVNDLKDTLTTLLKIIDLNDKGSIQGNQYGFYLHLMSDGTIAGLAYISTAVAVIKHTNSKTIEASFFTKIASKTCHALIKALTFDNENVHLATLNNQIYLKQGKAIYKLGTIEPNINIATLYRRIDSVKVAPRSLDTLELQKTLKNSINPKHNTAVKFEKDEQSNKTKLTFHYTGALDNNKPFSEGELLADTPFDHNKIYHYNLRLLSIVTESLGNFDNKNTQPLWEVGKTNELILSHENDSITEFYMLSHIEII